MSWTDELLAVYEQNKDRAFNDGELPILPLYHSTANAQIEILIDESGKFLSASKVPKDDAETVIPVTEDSATRSSGAAPMPFADKLKYLARDFPLYLTGKQAKNDEYHSAYMTQLRMWKESEYSHPAVKALYAYLEQGKLMSDLAAAGVLEVDQTTGELISGKKINNIAQEDSFVRVLVSYDGVTSKTWQDKNLQNRFILLTEAVSGDKELCYATGEIVPVTYKHPAKIRNSGDKAKLFSTNDESGFTYRGRFRDKGEAVAIGYEFSQKIFNALRWLVKKQGISFGSLTFVAWASAMQEIPKVTEKLFDDEEFDDEELPTTAPMYRNCLKQCIFSYKEKLEPSTKVMLLGIDAATTGRANLSFYSELAGSEFLANIENWHKETAWYRYSSIKKVSLMNSFSLYEIIKCAFGTEQGKFIDCDKKILGDNVLRIIPCVISGRRLPLDLVNALYYKASNPQSYAEAYNHRLVLEVACGMIRKSIIEKNKNNKEDYLMAYDPNITDRSYLFGCLLAIAEKAESEAYDKEERGKRETNARRYWSNFVQRPCETWQIIREKLNPYLSKLGIAEIKYAKRINEIMDKIEPEAFYSDRRLAPIYLLGYSHYMTKMFAEDTAKKKEEN